MTVDLSTLDQYYSGGSTALDWPTDHRTFNAPQDDVAEAVLACVRSTEQSLVLSMYSFTYAPLISAVTDLVQSGLPALVVLDSSCYENEEEQRNLAPLMACRGMESLRLSVGTSEVDRQIVHRKVFVADGELVVGGSFNWTTDATEEDNQVTVGLWPVDAAYLTSCIETTYQFQMANDPQPAQGEADGEGD